MSTDTDDTHGDHAHHLPAVEDWPQGFGEASWWPFVTSAGAAGIYIAVALFIIASGQGQPLISPQFAPAVAIASVGVFLAGLYGWLYHAFVTEFWSAETAGEDGISLRWGMVAFLGSECGTFGALFGYYFFVRATAWPPTGTELPGLLSSLVLANTALLIASSFTLHWAHVAIRRNDHRKFVLGLGVTLLLGTVFLGGQVLEYYEFIVHEGFSITNPQPVYQSAFYGLTGLHGLHVTLGAVMLAIVFVRALMGQYTADRHVSVSTVSMYWHFVDAVWIFLVVVLYVGAVVGGTAA